MEMLRGTARSLLLAGVLGLLAVAGAGCMNTEKVAQLQAEVDQLNQVNMIHERENRELMQQLEEQRMQLDMLRAELEGKNEQIDLLEQKLASRPRGLRDPLSEKQRRILRGIAESIGGELVENRILLPGDFLFASGSWGVRGEAKVHLRRIAEALQSEAQGLVLMLVGHTDNEPIKKLKKKGITSNRQLSLMRSLAVLNYLKSIGYPAGDMYPTGWGDLKPIDTNETAQGRANNRRVEIFIDPLMSDLVAKSAISGVSVAGEEEYAPMPMSEEEEEAVIRMGPAPAPRRGDGGGGSPYLK
jgi:flagellar motor protein MotB